MQIKNLTTRKRVNWFCERLFIPWIAFPPCPGDARILFCKRDRSDFAFLSNFYPCRLWIDGIDWNNVEVFYQANKSDNPAYREKLLRDTNPRVAKRIGDSRIGHSRLSKKSWFRKRPEDLSADWDSRKLDVMRAALKAKFSQNRNLYRSLRATAPLPLVEDSYRDSFWGAGPDGLGSNWLGKLLMEIRD